MDQRLKELFVQADETDLSIWTDSRMVDRAYGYLDKIEDMAYVDGQGVFAKVRGTNLYYTHVFRSDDNGLESECSCPVRRRCKHGVAVIMSCRKSIDDNETIDERAENCELVKESVSALADANKAIPEREQKILEARLAKEREAETIRQETEKRRTAAMSFFGSFLGKMRKADAKGDVKSVLKILDEACAWTSDDFDIMSYGHELYDLITAMSRIALAAMDKSGMSDWEKIVYAHFSNTPYRYYAPPSEIYDEFWDEKHPGRFTSDTWAIVGAEIKRRIAEKSVAKIGYHEAHHHVRDAVFAFSQAGLKDEAASLCADLADVTLEWGEAADMLLDLGRIEEAKAVLLRGMHGTYLGDGSFEDFAPICDKYADALSAGGNHGLAATVRTGAFLFRSGGYSGRRTVELYDAILEEADKAHAKDATRMALLRILKTGIVPKELAVWEPCAQAWYRPEVSVQPAPPWPLPPLPREWKLRLSVSLWNSKDEFLADQALVREIESTH
ncbi:MAG: hypothetical protein IJU44_04750 [Kiritimatiellae bacterium]|nr:hypothetical protein [Kiritimatiellia bacterium]